MGIGAKESDTGLAPMSQWNLAQDKKRVNEKTYMVGAPFRSEP